MDQYTKITITIPEYLSPDERETLRLLFKDALGEFVAVRTPEPEYVNRRYGDRSGPFRERKEVEVRARVLLALKVKAAMGDIEFIDPSDFDRD